MTKAVMRGIYGPKKGLINGHLDMERTISAAYKSYTYIMNFTKEFNTRHIESKYDQSQSNVQQNQPYSLVGKLYTYQHFHHVQKPLDEVIHQLSPMFYLPIKYR